MFSFKSLEKELKQLQDISNMKLPTISNSKTLEQYQSGDYSECIRNLITFFISSVNSLTSKGESQSEPELNLIFDKLNSTISETNMLKLKSILNSLYSRFNHNMSTSNIASTIINNNDFFLNLLAVNQSLINHIDSSAKFAKSSTNELDKFVNVLTTIYLNNIGLVHYSIQKYNLSYLYFKKSLDENYKFFKKLQDSDKSLEEKSNMDESSNNKLNNLLMNRRYEILYNMGISLLFSKQPLAAFECLYQAVEVYHQNARLWLRLAECCIMCYRHSLSENSENDYVPYNLTCSGNEKITKLSERIKCVNKSIGSGYHHKIELGTSLEEQAKTNDKNTIISLEFAHMCLRNALNLLPSNQQIFNQRDTKIKSKFNQNDSFDDEASSTNNQDGASETTEELPNLQTNSESEASPNKQQKYAVKQLEKRLFNCVWPSKPINVVEIQNLRSSILASAAFIALCLKDYISCIKYCQILLDKDDQLNVKYPITKGHRYLAHLYISEALLYSDKISESIENLNANTKLESDSDISFEINSSNELGQQTESLTNAKQRKLSSLNWYPKDVNTARAISFFNLSVAHVVRSEIDIALKNFNLSVSLFDKRQPAYTFFMKIYLDLLDGQRQNLQAILKENFGHVTLNKSIQSNSSFNSNSSNQKSHNIPGISTSSNNQQQANNAHSIQQLQQSQVQQLQPQSLNFSQHLLNQLQMQQLQHQLQQQQQQTQMLAQNQNHNQFIINPNSSSTSATTTPNVSNMLLNSFNTGTNNTSGTNNPALLLSALSPFNSNSSGILSNNNNSNNLNSAFANLPNLNSSNILSTLAAAAAAAAAANSNNSNSNNAAQLNLFSSAASVVQQQQLPNLNQLNINSLLLQQQQQQQQQNSSYLSQNQMPNRIS